VPAGSLTYQDKFEGLYKHFELDGMCIKGSDGLSLDRLITFFNHTHRLSNANRTKVLAKLPHVNNMARHNITALLGDLLTSE
jgi:polysaccharide pyruvyl transferase WcaK-like protein